MSQGATLDGLGLDDVQPLPVSPTLVPTTPSCRISQGLLTGHFAAVAGKAREHCELHGSAENRKACIFRGSRSMLKES